MKGTKSLSIIMAIAFVALVAQIFLSLPVLASEAFRHDIAGRFVSAEYGYDTSTVSAAGASPVFFATAATMVFNPTSREAGFVCGEADGFYPGISAPGINLGPVYFHGTYSYGPVSWRITIYQCSTAADTSFCNTTALTQTCDATTATSGTPATTMQVGYVQYGAYSTKIVTVDQITPYDVTAHGSTAFLVHKHEWTKVGD